MEILRIRRADIKNGNYRKGDIDFEGHIEIDADLGTVRFASLTASGHIIAEAGTGIEASEGIKAGEGIEAGEGIKAGTGIKAGEGIEAGTGIKAGEGIRAGWGIKAGEGIKAGTTISAKLRIFAGLIIWRKPSPDELEIHCQKLTSGEIAHGNLVEL